jgi:hypothetical protein
MKRIILSVSLLGLFGLLTGCDEKDRATTTTEVKTPKGSETKKITETDSKTGDMKTETKK